MNLREELLKRLYAGEVSGEELAAECGVTRAAVWKCVRSLISEGHKISGTTNRGYMLAPSNVVSCAGVEHFLRTPWSVEVLPVTSSTNDVAKNRAAGGATDLVVIADSQTAGKGRLRRSFFSPGKAGVYLSAVIRPDLGVSDCGLITACAAVATARAVEDLSGADVKIKWVNDLYIGSRKICGILTEGSVGMEGGSLDYAVVGIGVNALAVKFPSELENVATSVEAETGKAVDRCELAARILDNLHGLDSDVRSRSFVNEYRRRSCVTGRTVTVNGEYDAVAVGIDDDCALLLDVGGRTIKFSAGEVSLKLK